MRLRTAHVSLEFGDSDKQHEHDINAIFSRAIDRKYAWITGTEAGPGAGNTSELLASVGKDADYKMYIPSNRHGGPGSSTDAWVGVRDDLVVDGWAPEFIPTIPGSSQLYKENGTTAEFPKWGPKGLVAVSFESLPQLGKISVMSGHHLTLGREPGKEAIVHGVDHYEWNLKMDAAITKWVREKAKGSALAFGAMDRNLSDRKNPSTVGTTTLADELKMWQNTGHGDIDWMFSANKDGRVKGVNFLVLDDHDMPLFTDHWFCEGTYEVQSLLTKKR